MKYTSPTPKTTSLVEIVAQQRHDDLMAATISPRPSSNATTETNKTNRIDLIFVCLIFVDSY